ncbi:glycoside hydrolase family 3 C-terminal domain-containing protein [Luedemannella helvata]|uniref:Glycoside hydrolase family 3 protein n=1 Tax=Luedemannella helvata TaxID=349315 RepID=A0ABN2XW49_9ACTN
MSDSEASAYTNGAVPLADRITDLLSRLTLEEKIALLHQHQPAIDRLGVGTFRTGTEALHGLAWLGEATVFPQAVGLGATWDLDLVRRVGEAVGDEVRGLHHKDPERAGLNVWAPVVNQLRDPRWGRNEEGYAEDPLLTGAMGTAYSRGLRGDHPVFLKTAPTLKHFLGYNNETRRDRTSSNLSPRVLHEYELPPFRAPIADGAAVAVMASYNLVNNRPAHLSPLINEALRTWTTDEILVVSDAQAPSNVVESQAYYPDHAAATAALLKAGVDSFTDNDAKSEITIARVTGALERGLITEADVDTALRHIFAIRFRLGEFDPAEANPFAAITADVINCSEHQRLAREAARAAIVLLKNDAGLLPLAAPRKVAVLGPLSDVLFEDWYSGTLPYQATARRGLTDRLGDAVVSHEDGVDRVVLREAGGDRVVTAAEHADGAALRLAAGQGEFDLASDQGQFDLFDWGNGVYSLRAVANGRHVTAAGTEGAPLVNNQPGPNGWVVRETFRLAERADGALVLKHVASDRYVAATEDGSLGATARTPAEALGLSIEPVRSGVDAAVAAAREADVAIVVLGNHPLINGRECEDRVDLDLPPTQQRLIEAVHAANPSTVLVLTSSYPYAIGWADEHVPAILWSAHGGQEFGNALAEVLLGDVSPAGRLPQTWYADDADLPDLLDYDIIASDATYLYFRGTPLYPFGHGLTYSRVEYRDLRVSSPALDADGEVTVTVEVVNTGAYEVAEVVQLYTRQQRSRVKLPVRQLRGFAKVRLAPGGSATVTLPLRAADLAFWDVTQGRMVVEEARHTVMVGASATDVRATAVVDVRGEQIAPRAVSGRSLRAADHDDYCGIALVDESTVAGDAVGAIEPGAWITFDGVDLGRGVRAVGARVAQAADSAGTITLRVDDPVRGQVVATLTVPPTGSGYAWTEVSAPAADATGVRDLYLIFDAPGTRVAELRFDGPGAEA